MMNLLKFRKKETKTVARVGYTFKGCDHKIFRKETEPEPRECPYCREIWRKHGEA